MNINRLCILAFLGGILIAGVTISMVKPAEAQIGMSVRSNFPHQSDLWSVYADHWQDATEGSTYGYTFTITSDAYHRLPILTEIVPQPGGIRDFFSLYKHVGTTWKRIWIRTEGEPADQRFDPGIVLTEGDYIFQGLSESLTPNSVLLVGYWAYP